MNELFDQWIETMAQSLRDYEEVEHVVFNEPRENAAIRWALKCLGNNDRPETQEIVDAIAKRRAVMAERAKMA